MARPPGTSYLGAQPTTVNAWLGSYGKNLVKLVADSGADITLISDKTLKQMEAPPKIKNGLPIQVVEITGGTTITGYVTLPIFIDTDKGC